MEANFDIPNKHSLNYRQHKFLIVPGIDYNFYLRLDSRYFFQLVKINHNFN